MNENTDNTVEEKLKNIIIKKNVIADQDAIIEILKQLETLKKENEQLKSGNYILLKKENGYGFINSPAFSVEKYKIPEELIALTERLEILCGWEELFYKQKKTYNKQLNIAFEYFRYLKHLNIFRKLFNCYKKFDEFEKDLKNRKNL